MSEELEPVTELRRALGVVLDDERKGRPPQALCNYDPESWLAVASKLVQGQSLLKTSKETGIDRGTCREIQAIVLTHEDAALFRQMKSRQLATKSMQIAELENKILDVLLDGSELSEERIREMGPKELQLLAIAGKVDIEAFDRITGNNVQRIEVKHITTPEEAMDLIDSLPSIEAEEV